MLASSACACSLCMPSTVIKLVFVPASQFCLLTKVYSFAGWGLLRPQQCACRLQVLNAMLLACSGDAGKVAVGAMEYLLREGAVPDTWAPNGSSVSLRSALQVFVALTSQQKLDSLAVWLAFAVLICLLNHILLFYCQSFMQHPCVTPSSAARSPASSCPAGAHASCICGRRCRDTAALEAWSHN